MAPDASPRPSPFGILIALVTFLVVAAVLVDRGAHALAEPRAAAFARSSELQQLVRRYFVFRARILPWLPLIAFVLLLTLGLLFRGAKALTASLHRARERAAGFAFHQASYALPRVDFSLRHLIEHNPHPDTQIVLGVDAQGAPVYLTDRVRSMHLHVLGQTGSGKTKSVIEPAIVQDLLRRRGVFVVDGKGSQDNEERLLAMAALAGRLADVRIFTLNPFRQTHSYNPLHLTPSADPKAIAERVFSSFADDMDVPYYRDQSRLFFVSLIQVLAATARPFSMLDVAAAIASPELLRYALSLSSDAKSKRALTAQLERLGPKVGETFTGLLAAVNRYDHPALNAYDPDIVLEDQLDRAGIVAFYLPANYFKQLARYIGVCVFQHIQQIGALRQLDRSRPQSPVYVYADEFYTFAYEGFTDAVNKLRDANISILLSHQSFSDLEKVSPEYASGIWDNTRTKIVLYQNDPDVCERIAKSLGTTRGVELTVQRAADGFLNPHATLVASSREVDSYRCHPNRIKALECGQAYLAQDAYFTGVNLRTIPDAVFAQLHDLTPPPPRPQASANGLGLHALFVAHADDAGRPSTA